MRYNLTVTDYERLFYSDRSAADVLDIMEEMTGVTPNVRDFANLLSGGDPMAVEGHTFTVEQPEDPAESAARAYLAQAKSDDEDERLTEADSYATDELRGSMHMLEGNGPTVWFFRVCTLDGDTEFGVFEHSGFGPSTYAVVPDHDADIIDQALRREA